MAAPSAGSSSGRGAGALVPPAAVSASPPTCGASTSADEDRRERLRDRERDRGRLDPDSSAPASPPSADAASWDEVSAPLSVSADDCAEFVFRTLAVLAA